jgi:hypothetical protein
MALLFAKNNSLSAVTALPASISGGGLNLISTQTASSSASINFTSGLDSTYKHYVFKFYNFHPQNNAVRLKFNGSDDTSSHSYETGTDEAQSSGSAFLGNDTKNDDDASMSGYLEIFDPSSTVFVKHFISRATTYANGDYAVDSYKAGYFNTTSAITAIQFTASSGNIDSGTFKLYGVT